MSAPLPLVRKYPALAALPRAALGDFPSPVERLRDPSLDASLAGELWVKRDDLNARAFGGNKVRALEWLLGDAHAGDTVLTIGGEGSTHVLSTAEHAAALGVEAHAIRWRHEMHEVSHKVAARSRERASVVDHALAPIAMLRAMAARRSVSRYIPLGGTSPLGMLGHVNAGLELAEQVARGEMPAPNAVVVPLGSGGTAAGLALGFRIASLGTLLVAARVGPLIAANRWRVLALASRAARLIERVSGERVPRVRARDVRVVHDVYGGAYGRVLPRAASGADIARRALGLTLDDTYSAKAFTAALDLARTTRGVTLFWSTFDGRWMYEG